MSGLSRLHPHLQHGIVHELGWRSLRPVQDLTIDAVLDGCNAVVLAPTAGGKTEASIFPVLSRILSEQPEPVAALYVCPIRALLNNQEERLQSYARMVGLDAFKWHGDVAASKKQTFRRSPCHLLMTTPESLEVMMISAKTDAQAVFKGLSVVIIDEVHAFAADDRGAHLASLLERLATFCGRDIQRIGLSATVGNPLVIGEWLQGSSKRPFRLVDPPKDPTKRELRIDYCEDVGEVAAGIAQIARGRKSLVFVESRSKAERVAHALGGSGVEVFIHHSSVSRADRTLAEEQFTHGENTAIVCTSTMELGIDVGDLDQVIQVDAPASVASFLQRIGRTGRREGKRPNCAFFCQAPEALLQAVALLRLAEQGWVEDVAPAAHAMHVLAHQVMALALQEGGISRHRILPWIESAFPFSGVREQRFQELVDTMLERDILYEADGLLSMGARGEKLYGRKNFFELYAVFTAPPVLRVVQGRDEVGYVQANFVLMHDRNDGPLCFRLAGRPWQVVQADWSRGILRVKKAEHGRVPSWLGLPGALSQPLCQEMMHVLIEPAEEASWLTRSASLELDSLRSGYVDLLELGTAPLETDADGVQWHTFAGAAINRLLAAGLQKQTGQKWQAGNLSLRCKELAGPAATEAIAGLLGLDWETIAIEAAHDMARGVVSKFQPCLPKAAEDRLLAERLLDLHGTLRFLGSVRVNGRRVLAGTPTGRLADDTAPPPQTAAVHVPRTNLPASGPKNAIVWVDTAEQLAAAVADLESQEVVGLDVETTTDFGSLCLIQLATAERTYLIDPLALETLDSLASVLGAERPTKIIHHADFERRILAAAGISLGGVLDTLHASRRKHGVDALGGHSLAIVCERELGRSVDKSEQTSNWARRPLDPLQLQYAALDAEILLSLESALRAPGSTESP